MVAEKDLIVHSKSMNQRKKTNTLRKETKANHPLEPTQSRDQVVEQLEIIIDPAMIIKSQ